ncbi:uncharacterized protein LOC125042752 [Penaeus chinensis]|uniref:uncharacterized protein LOC125042752 n=1 Tax=Penaeus chinensis TaxID=139456 RepID=UPI001FB7E744|nr:uncharacterized protein LOC125042752 [Penaeus chinensis]
MEKPAQFTFKSSHYETFQYVAVSPHRIPTPNLLVVGRRSSSCGGFPASEDLLFLKPVPVAWILLSRRLRVFQPSTTSLCWSLVPWLDRACVVREREFAVISTKEEITILHLSTREEPPRGGLEHTIRTSVSLSGCVIQPSVPRLVFAGESVVGKVDLYLTDDGLNATLKEMRSDWVAEKGQLHFLCISCMERKMEVVLGDREGKVYICLIDSSSDTFSLVKEIALPFAVCSLSTCMVSRSSTLLVSVLGAEGQAVVLHLASMRLSEIEVCPLLTETPLRFASWFQNDKLLVLTAMDSEGKIYFWKEVQDGEGKTWALWGMRPLGGPGLALAWHAAEGQWLAYSTRCRVALVDMGEINHM